MLTIRALDVELQARVVREELFKPYPVPQPANLQSGWSLVRISDWSLVRISWGSWSLVRISWERCHWSGYLGRDVIGQDILGSCHWSGYLGGAVIGQDILRELSLVRIFWENFHRSGYLGEAVIGQDILGKLSLVRISRGS